jgi:signal transduction histidine kinase
MVIFAKTVQRKLLLLLLTVGMVPAAIGILHTYYGVNVGFSQVLEDLVQDEARQSTRRLDELLLRGMNAAQLAREQIQGADLTTEQVDLALMEVSRPGGSGFFSAVLSNASGQPLQRAEFGTTMGLTNPELNGPIEIPRGLWAGQKPRHFFSEVSGYRGPMLRLHVAIESDNSADSARPALLTLDLAARDLLDSLRGPSAGAERRILSNRGGTLVAGVPNEPIATAFQRSPDAFERYDGTMSISGAGDGSFVTGYATSRFLAQQRQEGRTSVGWMVVSTVDLEEARTVGTFLLWRSILLGLVLIPFLILLSTVLAQRFLQPLRQIHASLNRLGEGRIAARVHVNTGDEFEDLAEAYNRMAERIKQASIELLSQIRSSRRQAREVTLVQDVCQSLAAEFDRDRLFETARKRLTEILRHDVMTAVVADPAGHSTLHHFSGGAVRDSIPALEVLRFCQGSIREWASYHHQPSGTFLAPHGTFSTTGIPNPDCHELAIVPLLAGEILLGALIFGRLTPEPFSDEELQSAKPIARFLAMAAEHIQLYERTVHFAEELEATVRTRTDELKAAHRQLLMTERFAATGKLAANIAHEINNPLGIIKNYIRIHRNSVGNNLPDDSHEALSVMEEELDRIARIVRRLLDFYRTPGSEPAPTDINLELLNIMSLMGSTLQHKGIQVETHLAKDLPKIQLVPDLLRQVILNICKNAEEAMDSSGTLLLATSLDPTTDPPNLRLEIADTGCGIPQEHLGQIFEPFFTSKAEGQGTGLGLAVTYGILRGMGGTISVESDVGLGTRFTISFPAPPKADNQACRSSSEQGTHTPT